MVTEGRLGLDRCGSRREKVIRQLVRHSSASNFGLFGNWFAEADLGEQSREVPIIPDYVQMIQLRAGGASLCDVQRHNNQSRTNSGHTQHTHSF